MVRKKDGTTEGLPQKCPTCDGPLTVVTLELHHVWGYDDMESAGVTANLRCMKCNPAIPEKEKPKDYDRKCLIEVSTVDKDAVAEAIQFFKEKNEKQPILYEVL